MTDPRKASRYRELGEPAWEQPVAELLLPLVQGLSLEGTALVAECRTGLLSRRLGEALPKAKRIMAVDPDRDLLDAARGEESGPVPVYFHTQSARTLTFADDVFELAFCAPLMGSVADVLNTLSELTRVTAPGGWMLFAVPGSGSLALMDELLAEAQVAYPDASDAIEDWRATRTTAHAVSGAMASLQLQVVDSGVRKAPIHFASADALWDHPVVQEAFLPRWKAVGDDGATRERLLQDLRGRLQAYYGTDAISSDLEVLWWLARVQEEASYDVSDADVLAKDLAPEPPPSSPAASVPGPTETTMNVDVSDILARETAKARGQTPFPPGDA